MEIGVSGKPFFYIDRGEHERPRLVGGRTEVSFPVVIEGTAKGYSWSAASQVVDKSLSRLCALLSVALDAQWEIRDASREGGFEGRELPISSSPEINWNPNDNYDKSEVIVPSWCQEAWLRIESDDALLKALHAHHRGLALERVSPSYALIAYVGVVEGLGAKIEDLTACDCCSDCDADKGAWRRFRASVKLVCSRKEAKLVNKFYTLRSDTAHEGTLYGGEAANMLLPVGGMFSSSGVEGVNFKYQTLQHMRSVSRRLLLHYLRG